LMHRPDLGVQTAAGPVAIEVELQREPRARLLGILRMYAHYTDGDKAPRGVAYICDRADVADAVRRAATPAWLEAPARSFRTMDDVDGQTRAAVAADTMGKGPERPMIPTPVPWARRSPRYVP
jgi:hypothetical protein